jgi:hypothetical protein
MEGFLAVKEMEIGPALKAFYIQRGVKGVISGYKVLGEMRFIREVICLKGDMFREFLVETASGLAYVKGIEIATSKSSA